MNDLQIALEDLAERAEAWARPPALVQLQRRRSRRSAARGAGVVVTCAVFSGAAVALVSPDTSGRDVVVADAPPSAAPAPVPSVPPGKVAVPPYAQAAGVLTFAAGEPPLADLLSTHAAGDGVLVTAGQRRGEDVCTTVFVVDAPGAQPGPASCDPVTTGGAARPGRLSLAAASSGPSGGPVRSLVLSGSAPAGTRTVVVSAAGQTPERLPVVGAGPHYGDRVWFALPWVKRNTVVQALDAQGRVLVSEELLLGMGEGR